MEVLKGLTEKQRAILDFIVSYINEHGYSPTSKDIKEHFKFNSINAAYEHLFWIEKKGYIKRTPKIARSIVVLQA